MTPEHQGLVAPSGSLGLKVIRGGGQSADTPGRELSLAEVLRFGAPAKGLPDAINDWREENLPNLRRGIVRQGTARAVARRLGLPYMWSQLWLTKITADGLHLPLGLVGVRVVTTAGVGYIVDAFQNAVELEDMKYHGIGTDNTAEASGDTDLVAELTTEYQTNNTRATGTTAEGASANIYQTVATNTVDATAATVEHGIFSNATVGSGVLLDRTVFAVVNLAASDSLQSTYELTIAAGG